MNFFDVQQMTETMLLNIINLDRI
uniref:Uncharacterized protein n=1 Tax=Arundo donax TaxID=35708 RepID=A0A0A9HTI0_ARUDO